MRRSLIALAAVALVAAPGAAAETCGHGTKLDFVDSPKEAAAVAKKEQKLVLGAARLRALRRPGPDLKQRRRRSVWAP